MKIRLNQQIEIEASVANEQAITAQLTFNNPKHNEALQFGRSTRGLDPQISLISHSESGKFLAPMGALDYLLQTFNPDVIDERNTAPVDISFTGTLRGYQEQFIGNAINAGGGQMVAATGSGKTVSGIAMAARLQQRTLILVKSKDLAKQWKGEIKEYTGLDAGLIGGGKYAEGAEFTVALTQTLSKRDLSLLNYGLVIADECHNLPAKQAYTVMTGLNCKYKYGLSATPQRRDNMEVMISGAIGEVCAEVKPDELQGKVLPVQVSTLHVPFNESVDSWADFLNVLVEDEQRNKLICEGAIKSARKMGTIVLCAQVRHCELLASYCIDFGVKPLVLHGQLSAKVRAERMEAAPEAQLIIGTLSLLSEGIDLPHLSALIFASPVSAAIDKAIPSATRLIQSIGRCRRPYPNKYKAYVLDIIDGCGFGVSAWNKRKTIYQQQGFVVG